jgi:hypothetical protein
MKASMVDVSQKQTIQGHITIMMTRAVSRSRWFHDRMFAIAPTAK